MTVAETICATLACLGFGVGVLLSVVIAMFYLVLVALCLRLIWHNRPRLATMFGRFQFIPNLESGGINSAGNRSMPLLKESWVSRTWQLGMEVIVNTTVEKRKLVVDMEGIVTKIDEHGDAWIDFGEGPKMVNYSERVNFTPKDASRQGRVRTHCEHHHRLKCDEAPCEGCMRCSQCGKGKDEIPHSQMSSNCLSRGQVHYCWNSCKDVWYCNSCAMQGASVAWRDEHADPNLTADALLAEVVFHMAAGVFTFLVGALVQKMTGIKAVPAAVMLPVLFVIAVRGKCMDVKYAVESSEMKAGSLAIACKTALADDGAFLKFLRHRDAFRMSGSPPFSRSSRLSLTSSMARHTASVWRML